ncbi:MAG TPA: class I SAM-dependent methyltransferase [Anaerolineae bacterium]|nr:class I SAM-dependent methyltransferase [Anaerolineae bacterium]HQI84527.1 class I SAM-dependent methyltransferase [Anaerolineae bacterium]
MKGYKPLISFGEDIAATYRDVQRGDEHAAVAFLAHLAKGGPALELAIGAGRIALPLAAQGIQVDGIDISPPMLDQLRAKPGGDNIAVTVGDFADVPVTGVYRLIFVVWNTLFNLLTQEDQIRCFQNVAAHLTADGAFVIETYMPTFLYRLRADQYVNAEMIEVDEVKLDVLRHDAATQMIEESHVSLSQAGIHLNPVVQRYAWPTELDLMARIAGLRLKERWGSWHREPFDSNSALHVSVYGR